MNPCGITKRQEAQHLAEMERERKATARASLKPPPKMIRKWRRDVEKDFLKCNDLAQRTAARFPTLKDVWTGTPSERLTVILSHVLGILDSIEAADEAAKKLKRDPLSQFSAKKHRPKDYDVVVERAGYAEKVIRVNSAKSELEAAKKAFARAGDAAFSEQNAQYEVLAVIPTKG